MNPSELKEFLLWKADQYEQAGFIETDPISIPHYYSRKEDIEIIGLLVALISWGNRKAIIQSGKRLIQLFGESPYDYVMHFDGQRELHFVHRTFSSNDLRFFLLALKNIYLKEGLEATFQQPHANGIQFAIANFREAILETPHDPMVKRHLSNPLINSSCKRINMFLRWMVRSRAKGVDFGLWNVISSQELHVPLDVHTGNIARKLGMIGHRKQNDWVSSELLHWKCRGICPEDPAKLDFALFGLGAFEKF
jgi:uncharacterized protein (TIGR02757 family)